MALRGVIGTAAADPAGERRCGPGVELPSNHGVLPWGDRVTAARGAGVSPYHPPSGQIILAGAAEAAAKPLTPPWEAAAQRPGRFGKWAKWSDWFPEPGSESTQAGRRWWGRTEPRQRRQRGHPRTICFPPSKAIPRSGGGGTSRHPVGETRFSGMNQHTGRSSPRWYPTPSWPQQPGVGQERPEE